MRGKKSVACQREVVWSSLGSDSHKRSDKEKASLQITYGTRLALPSDTLTGAKPTAWLPQNPSSQVTDLTESTAAKTH